MSPSTDPLAYSPCQVPLRRVTNVFDGISITVHAGCYYDYLEADRRWKKNGGNALWDIRQGDTGSYNCRNSVAHSRAVATDWNWSTNGMTRKQTPCPGDMPVAFYELCWEPLGYGWGARWRSKCDRMHISKLRSEGGDGVLYRTWDDSDEEDDMDYATFKKFMDDYHADKTTKPYQVWKDNAVTLTHPDKTEVNEKGETVPLKRVFGIDTLVQLSLDYARTHDDWVRDAFQEYESSGRAV